MMSGFIRLRLEEALSPRAFSELNNLRRTTPVIDSTLNYGGWICGGFARHLLLDGSTESYLSSMINNQIVTAGDIDLFFPSVEVVKEVIKRHDALTSPSQGGFAREMRSSWQRQYVKIQFVDHPDLIQPTIEGTLSRFDLVNCHVGIDSEHIYFPEGWREIESQRLIRIAHGDAPFLGSRILKYLEHRGMEGLTDDSYEKLHGWFIHAGNDFTEGGWSERHIAGVQGHVKKLHKRGLVRREDLIFFLNKWKTLVRENRYGRTVVHEVDWALTEICA